MSKHRLKHRLTPVVFYVVERYDLTDIKRRLLSLLLYYLK